MPAGSSQTQNIVFYEPQYFEYSATYKSWVKLFIKDVHELHLLPGFEGTQARFWLNHPIRWIQLVGIVVGVLIKPSFAEILIDDGSGHTIEAYVSGAAAETLKVDFEHDSCSVDISTLLKVKGTVKTNHKGELQIVVTKAQVLQDPLDELQAWEERVNYRKSVLDVPWHIPAHIKEGFDQIRSTEDIQPKTEVPFVRPARLKSIAANDRARQEEEKRSHSSLKIWTLEPRQHTQRVLKTVLLQYLHVSKFHEFSIAQLRSVPDLERSVVCVAHRKLQLQQQAVGIEQLPDDAAPITSTQKYRILNACLAELVREGAIYCVDMEQGMYCVIGDWNLGKSLRSLVRERLRAGETFEEISIRELWVAVRKYDQRFESVNKQMVDTLVSSFIAASRK